MLGRLRPPSLVAKSDVRRTCILNAFRSQVKYAQRNSGWWVIILRHPMRGLISTSPSSSQGRIRMDVLVVHEDRVRGAKGVAVEHACPLHTAGELMGLVSSASFSHTK